MSIDYDVLFGVDIAIKKLRPNAVFTLVNMTFVEWYDPDGLPPPFWEEIEAVVNSDKEKFLEKYPDTVFK